MNNWRHPVFSLGEDFPMFELKYDWSRRFQFEFEWIELTIVDNKLGRNGQLAGDWEGKVGGRIRSRNTAASFSNQKKIEKKLLSKSVLHDPDFLIASYLSDCHCLLNDESSSLYLKSKICCQVKQSCKSSWKIHWMILWGNFVNMVIYFLGRIS